MSISPPEVMSSTEVISSSTCLFVRLSAAPRGLASSFDRGSASQCFVSSVTGIADSVAESLSSDHPSMVLFTTAVEKMCLEYFNFIYASIRHVYSLLRMVMLYLKYLNSDHTKKTIHLINMACTCEYRS